MVGNDECERDKKKDNRGTQAPRSTPYSDFTNVSRSSFSWS